MSNLYAPAELQREVGESARKRRLALGLRQADLSAAAGVPLASVRRFEDGASVGFAAVVRMALALGTEQQLLQMFPSPETRSMDDLLRAQRVGSRKRVRKPR